MYKKRGKLKIINIKTTVERDHYEPKILLKKTFIKVTCIRYDSCHMTTLSSLHLFVRKMTVMSAIKLIEKNDYFFIAILTKFQTDLYQFLKNVLKLCNP